MSYILDALRRADAERERGAVPGIHAQPVPAESGEAHTPAAARPWLWIGLGSGVGLIAALAAFVATREAPPVGSGAPTAAAAPTPVAAPSAAASVAAAPAAAPERPQTVAPPAAVPLPRGATGAAAPPAQGAAQPPVRIYVRDELPEAVRSQLPPLAIGGAMYSTNPANRSLIIDGRLVREGEQIAPDLTLEQIKLKAAVLKFRSYLFEVAF
jgi:general secretion pathway protein B